MFGRATIRLGIGPHSSLNMICLVVLMYFDFEFSCMCVNCVEYDVR